MPRYFIDVTSGDELIRDEEGAEYESFQAARKEAIITLGDVSRGKLAEGDHRDFVAVVRDGENRPAFEATLSLILDEMER